MAHVKQQHITVHVLDMLMQVNAVRGGTKIPNSCEIFRLLVFSHLFCSSKSGVYILFQNFIIAPKRDKRVMKFFIVAPNLHVARNEIS